MRTLTNAGELYDSETLESVHTHWFYLVDKAFVLKVPVDIPAKVKRTVGTAVLDEIELTLLRQWYTAHLQVFLAAGLRDLNLFHRKVTGLLSAHAAERIYNEFILAQARLGNDLWRVPPSLSAISKSPDEDFDSTGRPV
jgi:hypothetical protein